MSVIVNITDTFPTHDILAVGSVKIWSSIIISGVMLKFDDQSGQYFFEFPSMENNKAVVKLCDKTLKEKLLDAMVYKYEEYILSQFENDNSGSKPYILVLEKERIERKYYRQQGLI
ncbi:hypothetical protein ACE38V_06525 [Cytobacillus sp. Hz8]|uniref:hypothetical protein n=1 Tax=Cytobacillus sp. Hz8 TaxID=3347168 RepID=UPI0035E30870